MSLVPKGHFLGCGPHLAECEKTRCADHRSMVRLCESLEAQEPKSSQDCPLCGSYAPHLVTTASTRKP
jgi:hypothetical protein